MPTRWILVLLLAGAACVPHYPALIRHEIAHDLGFRADSHGDPTVVRCTGPLRSSLSR